MKLISCKINNFGTLRDFSFDFSGGLNTFYRENGFGKSTLADFIKVMLYGMPTAKRGGKDFDDRTHYYPFGGGAFGGSLTIESGGVIYRIEREFDRKSETRDILIFTDESGNALPVPEEGIGEKFFGIDCESFVRTIYISREDIESEATSSINRKLNNLVDGTAKENDFDGVVKNLTRAYKDIRADRGREGSYYSSLDELTRCEVEITAMKGIDSALNEKYARLCFVGESVKQETAKYERAMRQKTELSYWEHYDGLIAEATAKKAEADGITSRYGGKTPEKAECIAAREAYRKKIEIEGAIKASEAANIPSDKKIAEINVRCSSCNAIKAQAEEIKNKAGNKSLDFSRAPSPAEAIVLLILGLIFAVSGAVIYFFVYKNPFIFIILGCGAAALIVSIILFVVFARKNSAYKLKTAYDGKIAEYNRSVQTLSEIFLAYGIEEKEFSSALSLLKGKAAEHKKRVESLSEELFAADEKVENFYSKYKVVKTSSFFNDELAVESDISRLEALEREIKMKQVAAEEYKKEKGLVARPDSPVEDIAVIEENIRNARKEYSALEAAISADERALEPLPAAEEKLLQLKEKTAKLVERYDLIKKTLHYIQAAEDGLKKKYISPVMDSYTAYAQALSPETAEGVQMNFNYNLMFDNGGFLRGDEYFSSGQRRCAELSLRLALIKNMYKSEAPFIIMDDPFVNLDEKRLENAKQLLRAACQDFQIIYFCCHQSRNV